MPKQEYEIKAEEKYLHNKAKELIQESVEAPPGRLSEINIELTSIKAFFSEKLDNILVFKADRLEELKAELKTVASAKVAWNSAPEGKDEIIFRGIIGRIKDQVSVIKSRIQVKHDEAFGSY